MKFKCPSCNMMLQAEADMAGKMVRCPGCDTKLHIPDVAAPPPGLDGIPPPTGVESPWDREKGHDIEAGSSPAQQQQPMYSSAPAERPHRTAWKETDPTNPNVIISFSIGFVCFAAWFAMLAPLVPAKTKQVADYTGLELLANLFYKHLLVSATNTLFFCWAIAILYLKWKKLRHQRTALMLDVLPRELGTEINKDNVGAFIDNLYELPHRLRDSLMVNRIRKALELFETRQSVADVAGMMSSQSDIDSARIGGSYTPVKAFLWAIPILGFVGTVLGLSHAIGGMNFANVDDVKAIIAQVNSVTSGLGTAFDATLLGLVLAMGLNFPMNALSKAEDDNLNAIDAFCNEVLIPRLNDGSGSDIAAMFGGGELGAFVEALAKALGSAQQELITDLKAVTQKVQEQATNLDKRADAHAVLVATEFSKTMITMRESMGEAVAESVQKTTEYVRTLASALQGLNSVLKDLGEKQVLIQQVKRKGWFSRD